ncbi:MAG TPA: hypothetical protein VGS97_21365 [Actinocrinis sp.]|nr:hypothetical protein [Actinocrinis sp.]HEV2346664.1 hypothetical protein [Actinocrinis sp.]
MTTKPVAKPARPWFSSGPCAKKPGWDVGEVKDAFVGRLFRHPDGQARLRAVIEQSKEILGLPADYRVAIVPGSDTGAIEMAMWNLLGHRAVEVCCWENFGFTWLADVVAQLRIPDVTVHSAERYGQLPDLDRVDFAKDVVFTWNGTTSGVRVPDGEWIPADRAGLTICDATSAVFGMPVDFAKLDVVTWSWQKALGGEGAHGMLALSPAAVERLVTFRPDRPLPKVFRLTRDAAGGGDGVLLDGLFDGFTINTPSMLAVEDARVAPGLVPGDRRPSRPPREVAAQPRRHRALGTREPTRRVPGRGPEYDLVDEHLPEVPPRPVRAADPRPAGRLRASRVPPDRAE